MKRTNIFMVAFFALGIIGAITSQASSSTFTTYYYDEGLGQGCQNTDTNPGCGEGLAVCTIGTVTYRQNSCTGATFSKP